MTTPPQGQNPYAQNPDAPYGQNAPYGQPGQPGPYGQPGQPGQPGWPPQGAPYQGVPMAPQGTPTRSGGKTALKVIGAVIGLVVIAGGWYLNQNSEDAKKLAVGDCLYNKGTDNSPDIQQVSCTDAKATHKVLKKSPGASLPSLTCQNVTGTTAAFTWKEKSDSFTLCLGDAK
ncbi:hypothetical protein [Streptomyces sp. NPDC050485]|uniref:LppU/SCO3897 family protein n=1 Tax=Streptomyces sp. NPDC050485 TaxID=3365617 RepID=UPI0037B1BF61